MEMRTKGGPLAMLTYIILMIYAIIIFEISLKSLVYGVVLRQLAVGCTIGIGNVTLAHFSFALG